MTHIRIPFGTLKITEKTMELVADCLQRGRISGGKMVRNFEERFAEILGVREVVAVSSGTDADMLAVAVLYDYGAERGDEVIVPALSFVSTGNAVVHAGLRPVFVDVDRNTLNIDPGKIEAAIGERTRAIMPVHLMGKPADMDVINEIAARHALVVIEDAAEAYGAEYKGKKVGTLGHMAAFSTYVAHIITTGEGGVIVTDNDDYAEVLRSLRAHGRACKCRQCISNTNSGYCEKRFSDKNRGDLRFSFERLGYSSKMNELEAAIGIGTLDHYDSILAARRSNLKRMIAGFESFTKHLWTFREESYECIGPHAFPFIVKEGAPFTRDDLMLYLENAGVDVRTLFASIPTQCGGYAFLGYTQGDFPNAEYIGRNGIHIGVHHDITEQDIDWFLDLVADFIARAEHK